jgi:hypothetical protein
METGSPVCRSRHDEPAAKTSSREQSLHTFRLSNLPGSSCSLRLQKALGIIVPPTLLAVADEVLE